MLDKNQRFQSEKVGNRIKVNNVPKKVSRDTLYTFCSEVGEVSKVQQIGPALPNEHKQFMVSFQQSKMAHCASLNALSLGGCKISLQPEVPGYHEDLPSYHSFNSHPVGSKLRLVERAENFSGARLTNKHAGGYHAYSYRATSAYKCRDGSFPESRAAGTRKNCNLYILNLSLNMTNESLKVIIQASGQVRHVCVLATLDNAGRRRAFVDMTTPEEAYRVVENLHGKRVDGYELHISYAFIQRSGGPTMPFDGNPAAKSHEQRPSGHQDFSARSSTPRKWEDRERHHVTKKYLNTAASVGSKINRHTKADPDLSPQIYHNPQSVPPLDSSRRTPESDRDSGFPSTPVSSYDSRARSPQTSSSVLFETSLTELNQYVPLAQENASSRCKILVFNLSPVACIDSDDLFRFFVREGFSQLKSAYLNIDGESGMSLGNGSLTFSCAEECDEAFAKMNSKDITFGGAKINCAQIDACNLNKRSNYSMTGVNSNFNETATTQDWNVNCPVSSTEKVQ